MIRKKLGVLLLFVYLSISYSANAQYNKKIFTDEDGLPGLAAYDILQTEDGYLWFATTDGLARFDGVKVTVYNKDNTEALNSSVIRKLYLGNDGTLWIGTSGGGVTTYKDREFSRPFGKLGGIDQYIVSFAETSDGAFWVGTDGRGLYKIVGDSIRQFTVENSELSQNHIFSLSPYKGDTLVVGFIDYGLRYFKDDRFIDFPLPKELETPVIYSIINESDSLFIGSRSGVFVMYEGEYSHYPLTDQGANTSFVLDMAKDGNALWVSTSEGVHRLDLATGELDRNLGLENKGSLAALKDKEGHIWIFSYLEGAYRIKETTFSSFGDAAAGAMVESTPGTFWVVIGNKLTKIEGNDTTVFGEKDGLMTDLAEVIYADSNERIYVSNAAEEVGIDVIDGSDIYSLDEFNSTFDSEVTTFYEDKNGQLWIGLEAGIVKWTGRNSLHLDDAEMSKGGVLSITNDQSGALWVGTNYGLNKLVADTVQSQYIEGSGLSNPIISALYNDDEDRLWIGTSGGGLNVKIGEKFIPIKTSQLPAETIGGIIEDQNGFLWVSTSNGIYYVKKQQLIEHISDTTKQVSYRKFTSDDGLPSNTIINGLVTSDNEIWFSTGAGIGKVNPDRILTNSSPPPILIEEIQVDNEETPISSIIDIPHDNKSIAIYYTSPSFIDSEEITFQYKLEPFQTEWEEVGTRRAAFYTNISPGNYSFHVRSITKDGVISSEAATLSLNFEHAYYETWWFRILIVIVVVSISVGFFQYRMANVKRMERVRLQIAGDLHDEIGSNLGSVILKSQLLEKKLDSSDEAVTTGLQEIRSISKNTSQAMRDIVWMINPKHDVVEDLVLQLKEISGAMLENINYTFESNVEFSEEGMNPEIRRNTVLILKECIHNIIKHSEASEVHISFKKAENEFILRVSDDGKGFAVNALEGNKHYGLEGMKNRAREIKGVLAIDSDSKSGTAIALSFKNYGGT